MNPYIQYMYSYPHKTAYRPLTGISLESYAHCMSGSGHGLYLHIPFCQTKCGYCNLFSVTGQAPPVFARYLDAVERQARQYQDTLSAFRPSFLEVSIGGGTPLLLPEGLLVRMFGILEAYFPSDKGKGLAIETAPNQTTREKLHILREAGAARVSMGIQSFSEQELKTLGRRHSARKAREALGLLKSFGFPCTNVDFIYGIPGQSIESLLSSLREALSFAPDEIFLYPLYLKHGAWLVQAPPKSGPQAAAPASPSAGVHPAYLQYLEASAFLKSEGYRQDSMRRFVKITPQAQQAKGQRPFSECGFGSSLALGCGGRSYLGNLHFCTPYAVTSQGCLRQLERFMGTEDYTQITHGMLLSQEERKRRYVIRHLFIRPGINIQQYQGHFGSDPARDFPLLQVWASQGYAQFTRQGHSDYLTLTEEGLGLSDFLGPQLISPEVQRRMEGWEP
ncbi:MAG: coproporphyrinogen III oxidase family protein [Lachnospiraceae bacterium]|nr:coproporphyrinogen III oxidase family protein [Lachnospiraceae bacterium]